MPLRSDLDDIAKNKAKERGIPRLTNQTAIDMVGPGDVLVVDLFGKKVNGTIVGDNLFYSTRRLTGRGWWWMAVCATWMEFVKSPCRLTFARLIPRRSGMSC